MDARYYPMARTVHLERLESMHPADFLYTHHRLDWDEEALEKSPRTARVTFFQVLRRVWQKDYERIEIPEPLAIVLLPRLVAIALTVKTKRVMRKSAPKVRLLFYAIENLDQVTKIRSKLPAPMAVIRWSLNTLLAPVLAETSRAAFGTSGAMETLRQQLGEKRWHKFVSHTQVRLVPGLPSARRTSFKKDQDLVCFLGSFETRKGIDKVLESWGPLSSNRPASRMVILGHGAMTDMVVNFCRNEDIEYYIDPSRERIRAILDRSHCLVLPSQRTPLWREQIGLPILEALESGCEIVTTTETGIAEWLATHSHQVLDPDASREALALAIAQALDKTRSAEAIVAALPPIDGRIAADHWLFTGSDPTCGTRESVRTTP